MRLNPREAFGVRAVHRRFSHKRQKPSSALTRSIFSAGPKPVRSGGPAQGRAGEDLAGVVVAAADDGVVALDWTKAGDGALYPRDPGGEPD